MSKSFKRPVKNSINLDVSLLSRVVNNLETIDNYAERTINQIFSTIETSIGNEISMAGRNARLSNYDEKIYEFYKRLMNYYESATSIYEQNRKVEIPDNIRKILEGINSILLSQQRQIDEWQREDNYNPISEERKIIISNCVTTFIKNYDDMKNAFSSIPIENLKEKSKNIILENIQNINEDEIFEDLLSEIEQMYFEDFYKVYCEQCKKCVNKLNDLNDRSVLNQYYTMLEEEHTLLTTIIKVQVIAVEEQFKKYNTSQPEYFVFRMLSALREGYQYLGKDIKDINKMFNDSETQNCEVIEYKSFVEKIRHYCLQDLKNIKFENMDLPSLNEKLEVVKTQLSKDFFALIERELKNYSVNSKVYELNKKISCQLIMADEMISLFKVISDFYCENEKGLSSCDNIDIIKGIFETIDIKIENINEHKNDYSFLVEEIIEEFKNKDFKLSKEDLELSFENAFLIWKESISSFNRNNILDKTTEVFKNEIDTGVCNDFIQRFNKVELQYNDKINKKCLQFKKETLLYEISTFEEIMNYSVSRLRETEDDILKAYVNIIESVQDKLNMVLSKNNIKIISPKPHDQFNGREHEVLMAEKNEDFKKGEIIKLMNSGYKEGDLVILRANVIGAK